MKAPGLLIALALLAWLPASTAGNGERARIAAERKALAQRFQEEERACTSRFAMTACVDEVRARRREALAPLREQELRLDEAERRQRAEERQRAIAQRKAEAASRPAAPPEPQAHVRQPLLGASGPVRTPKPADDGAARAAEAARRVQDAQQRQAEVEATRERIEKRQAEREAQGKKARPLPVPPAASAAR